MPIKIVKRYSRQEIQTNPDILYIFGDNYMRQGMGGQAKETRGEPNTVGVRTKKLPEYTEQSFLTDDDFFENIQNITEDLLPVSRALGEGKVVVWPEDGIGTGLAQLHQKAPLTFEFISIIIKAFIHVYGVV